MEGDPLCASEEDKSHRGLLKTQKLVVKSSTS